MNIVLIIENDIGAVLGKYEYDTRGDQLPVTLVAVPDASLSRTILIDAIRAKVIIDP